MKKLKFSGYALFFVLTIFFLFVPFYAGSTGQFEKRLTILTTADLQSQVDEFNTKIKIDGKKVKKTVGGIARVGYLTKKIKNERGSVIFLSSGDDFIGPYFRAFHGIPETLFWDQIADAWTPGNHEFDLGPSVLGEALSYATIPVLCANLDVSDHSALNGKIIPYTVKELFGVKVGIFGLITPNLPMITNLGDNIKINTDLTSVAEKMVRILKERQVDLIVALTHIGLDADRELAKEVNGIDVIVGGHSHLLMRKAEEVINPDGGKTIIVQDGARAAYLGELQLKIGSNGVSSYKWILHLLDENVAKDPVLAKMVSLSVSMLPPSKPVGKSLVDLDAKKSTVRYREAAIGNLFTDAMKDKFNLDIAVANGGGIRGDRVYSKGRITTKTLQQMHPFGNTIVIVKLTGAQVKEVLERGAAALAAQGDARAKSSMPPSGAFLQVSGVTFKIDLSKNPQILDSESKPTGITVHGNRVRDIYINGSPLNMNRVYKLGIGSFNAAGGDGYIMIKNLPADLKYDTAITIPQVLEEYIRSHSPIEPGVEGRIIIIK